MHVGRRILIACSSVPGYGGANTATYKLFELMRADGIDATYINIFGEDLADYFLYVFGETLGNPRQLEQVHNCVLTRPPFYPDSRHPEIEAVVRDFSPDVLVGVDFSGALLLKAVAPDKPVIFLTTGCDRARVLLEDRRTPDLLSLMQVIEAGDELPRLSHRHEARAVATADYVVTHSDVVRELYTCFFPAHAGKICSDVIWLAEWIYEEALEFASSKRAFEERDIDALFVANRWHRPEKGFGLLRQIVSSAGGAELHVVGELPADLKGATCYGLLTKRDELFGLMGRAKSVVCPSRFDAAPGVLFEASAMGCNIVTSKNCGNWKICHPDLLVPSSDAGSFLECIRRSTARKFDDNMDFFLSQCSYRKLLEILSVL